MKAFIGPFPEDDDSSERTINVQVDDYDVWNVDSTLALVIAPVLKAFKASPRHGACTIDDEDVPPHLRSTAAPPKNFDYEVDLFHFDRYEWLLDELIWTFETYNTEWCDQFSTGEMDYKWEESGLTHRNPDTGELEPTYKMVEGPNHTYVFDAEGYNEFEARINNGLRLFGKYFRALWD